jgi:endonuclease/exonuclease/phosphatase family metal-dependent hydrolase
VVFATHLGLKPGERRRQIDELARLLRARAGTPTVMMGDFNVLGPHAGALGRLGHPLGLRLRAPSTFPARHPFMALDRIWCLPSTLRLSVRVHRSALSRVASDHLPLVAEIALSED